MRIAPTLSYKAYSSNKNKFSYNTQPTFSATASVEVSKRLQVPMQFRFPKGLGLRNFLLMETEGKATPELTKEFDQKTGKLLRMIQYYRNKITAIYEYNPETQKMVREISFNEQGIKTTLTELDEKTGNLKQVTAYWSDGKNVDSITEYNPKNGALLKVTRFQQDGQTIDVVGEYNPKNSELIKEIKYRKDGKRIYAIKEYDPENGKALSTKLLHPDGKSIKTFLEYDTDAFSGGLVRLRCTEYHRDGRIKAVEDYKNNIFQDYRYRKNKKLESIVYVTLGKGDLIRKRVFASDGITERGELKLVQSN